MKAALLTVSLALAGTSTAFPAFLSGPDSGSGSAGNLFAAAQAKRQLAGTFDPVKQRIDVSGEHEFRAPGPNDQRGPCPGLNALANHGYINRNGSTTLLEAAEASRKVFGLGPGGSISFAVMGTMYGGNPVTEQFSIGGPVAELAQPGSPTPPGLSGTHNKMEGDASPTRNDAYANNGDASSLSLEYFKHLYDLVPEGSSKSFDVPTLLQHRAWTRNKSIQTNPHYFVAPVGALFVSTLTHFTPARLYPNHSAEHPEGYLNHDILKSFYAVNGNSDSLSHQPGCERIPDNWYRRPDDWDLPVIMADFVAMGVKYPEFFSLGGNTGTVNSFAGLNLGDLTGGVYNSANLLKGNNLICFALQAAMPAQPAMLGRASSNDTESMSLCTGKMKPILASLNCPELSQYNTTVFGPYPGASVAV